MTRSPSLATLAPRRAYDLVARQYDDWHWQEFWRRNELPVVRSLLGATPGATPGGTAGRILDLGTGTGLYLGHLLASGASGVGIDVSASMLAVARAKLGGAALLVQGDATALPMRGGTFDLVIAARVLSHVPDLDAAFAEVARVTRVGGRFVVTDVDPAHDYRATRLVVDGRSVYVDTYKWTAAQLVEAARRMGFVATRPRRLTAKNVVWLPDDAAFRSIDRTGSRPIGHILLFRRTARR